MQERRIGYDDVEFISWFLAAVNEGELFRRHEKHKFEVEFYHHDAAIQKLAALNW